MRTHTDIRPLGNDAATDFALRGRSRANDELQLFDSTDISVDHSTRGTRLYLKKRIYAAGGGGFPWQTPKKELDPTVAVAVGTAVYISPNNPLASVGLVDLVNGTVTISKPGIWLSVQAVPAKTGAGKYNVPVAPYPSDHGAVTGSPLSGDADATNIYWVLLSPTPYC